MPSPLAFGPQSCRTCWGGNSQLGIRRGGRQPFFPLNAVSTSSTEVAFVRPPGATDSKIDFEYPIELICFKERSLQRFRAKLRPPLHSAATACFQIPHVAPPVEGKECTSCAFSWRTITPPKCYSFGGKGTALNVDLAPGLLRIFWVYYLASTDFT